MNIAIAKGAAQTASDVHWISVCRTSEVPEQGSRVIQRTGRTDVALFRTITGRVFALLDRCPHKGGPLSQGIVHGEKVTCPLHAWNIEFETGEAVAPDVGCAMRFSVRVEDDLVWMDSNELANKDIQNK